MGRSTGGRCTRALPSGVRRERHRGPDRDAHTGRGAGLADLRANGVPRARGRARPAERRVREHREPALAGGELGDASTRVALGEGTVGPFRLTDAMVCGLAPDGRIRRISPHLRPWLALSTLALKLSACAWRAIRASCCARCAAAVSCSRRARAGPGATPPPRRSRGRCRSPSAAAAAR